MSTVEPAALAREASVSELVGRERELDEVVRAVTSWRIVTVLGPGGMGKTRLARRVADVLADRFSRIKIVELATLAAPGSPTEVASALGFSSVDAACASLADGNELVVLDNCEHVLDAVAEVVTAVVGSAPRLRVLTTSRESLGVDGEHVFVLPALSLAEGDDPEAVAASAAVALFCERARAAGADVTVDAASAPVLAALCRQLDGVPLAIELAAARARALQPAEILAHLADRFSLLTGRPGRGPARHRSLASAVSWSYDLLAPEDQRFFDRLGVFRDAFTAEAAHRVAADGHGSLLATVDRLAGLVDRSLLGTVAVAGTTRYVMLDTLRHFAEERLQRSDRWIETMDRDAARLLELTAENTERSVRSWAPAHLGVLMSEARNLVHAVRWSIEQGDAERALAVYRTLWGVVHQAYGGEVAALGRDLLDRWPDPGPVGWADAMAVAASAWLVTGDLEDCRALAERSVVVGADDRWAPVLGLRVLGLVDRHDGALATALSRFGAGATAARARQLVPWALQMEIMAAATQGASGDHADALVTVRAAGQEAARMASPVLGVWAGLVEGQLQVRLDPAAARTTLGRARRLADGHSAAGFPYPWGAAAVERALGVTALASEDVAVAAGHVQEALERFAAIGDRAEVWHTLRWATAVLHHAGQDEEAVALATSLGPDPGVALAPDDEALLRGTPADDRFGAGDGGVVAEREAAARGRRTLSQLAAAPAGRRSSATVSHRPAPAPTPPAEEDVWRRDGDMWTVSYAGVSVHLRDAKGLRDLATLLARPGEDVHCLDLVGTPVRDGGAGPALDERARQAYAARIKDLQDDLEEADAMNDRHRSERAQVELDRLVEELSRAYGLGGRERSSGDTAERARSSVTWRIRTAIRRVATAHPALGRHLTSSVRTGTWCSYRPDPPTRWAVQEPGSGVVTDGPDRTAGRSASSGS